MLCMHSTAYQRGIQSLYQMDKGIYNLMRHYSMKFHSRKYSSPHMEYANNNSCLPDIDHSTHSHMAAYIEKQHARKNTRNILYHHQQLALWVLELEVEFAPKSYRFAFHNKKDQ
jgi:hypothetical protein